MHSFTSVVRLPFKTIPLGIQVHNFATIGKYAVQKIRTFFSMDKNQIHSSYETFYELNDLYMCGFFVYAQEYRLLFRQSLHMNDDL